MKLHHFALLTYAVPLDRIREHLPDQLEPESFMLPERGKTGMISIGCFLASGLHWPAMSRPRMGRFEQITYRTYVTHKGKKGAYFFGSALGSITSFLLQGSFIRGGTLGKFDTSRTLEAEGYSEYLCRMKDRSGLTQFAIRAADRPENPELTQLLTYRLHGFARSRAGLLVDQVVCHARMNPWSGELLNADDTRFPFWEKLGMLDADEASKPVSVLVQPEIRFGVYPPLPLQLISSEPVEEFTESCERRNRAS